MKILIFLASLLVINFQCLMLNSKDWAYSCDFKSNHLKNVSSVASECGPKCLEEPNCTHFSWSNYNDGTCYMRHGFVSKSDAIITKDESMICGLFLEKMNHQKNSEMHLVWSDEFSYIGKPNSNEWNTIIGYGENNELQYYTDFNADSDGQFLTIYSLRQDYNGSRYTSSRFSTKRSFTYGVFEMRAKLPKGKGTWPAFWLLSSNSPLNWPYDGEIDIMEHVGYNPNVVHATIHCQSFYGADGKGSSKKVDDVFDTFHTYKIDWNSEKIRGYFDDEEYFVYYNDNLNDKNTWPYDGPMNIIINNAIGGDWGGAKGIDDSIFPTKYVIDYIRVYSATNNL